MSPQPTCQLLTEINDGTRAIEILRDPSYAAQQKFDGKRIILQIEGSKVTAYNRKGLVCSVSHEILREARLLTPLAPLTLDGEWLREIKSFQAFDLLELDGQNTKDLPFKIRQAHLCDTLKVFSLATIKAARTEYEENGKIELLQQVHAADLEGVVLKPVIAPYRPVRESNHYKLKFTAVSSFVVIKRNDKESVAIGLFDSNGNLIPCGDVKIRNNRFKLTEGMIIDVRYSHLFPQSLKVYQPRMERIRDDLEPESCTLSQARYKGTAIII